MKRALRRALFVPIAAAAAWGCNALLGNEDGAFVDDGDASVGNPDASLDDGSSSSNDGAKPGDGAAGDATDSGPPCVADFTSDPLHCGRCGHDCVGGGCTDSLCTPVTMVANAGVVLGFGANEENAYWTSTVRLMRQPLAGGPAIEFDDAPDATTASKLVVSATDIAWTLSPAFKPVQTCPAAGCPDSGPFALPVAAAQFLAAGMHDGTLYYSDNGDELRVTPLDGGPYELFADGSVQSIAIEPPYIYWATAKDGGSVEQVPLGGGTRSTVAQRSVSNGVRAVAVSGNILVYSTSEGVFRSGIDGGQPALVSAEPVLVEKIAIAGEWLYWRETTKAFKRCLIADCKPVLVTPNQLVDFAVTKRFVVWADKAGNVVRLAR